MRTLPIAILVLVLLPLAAHATPCKGLLGDDRAVCMGESQRSNTIRKYGSTASASSASSSKSSLPVSYPDVMSQFLLENPTAVPPGLSCIRLNDIARAKCRFQQLLVDSQIRIANQGRSSSSSSSVRPLSNRKHCGRLPTAGEQRECLLSQRQGITAGVKTLR